MISKNILRLAFISMASFMFFSAIFAVAANNTVPTTHLTDQSSVLTANDLKPAACSGITLTDLIVCTGGNCDGTGANELLLGTSGGERIRGRGGTDCILGGGGDDRLVGNAGIDVCIGGPGADTFLNCQTQVQ